MVSIISMPEIVDATSATKLAKQLLELRNCDVMLDAQGITRFSAFGLEVLIAASRQWQADGQVFDVANWSDAALIALQALGVEPADFLAEI